MVVVETYAYMSVVDGLILVDSTQSCGYLNPKHTKQGHSKNLQFNTGYNSHPKCFHVRRWKVPSFLWAAIHETIHAYR